MSGHIAAVTHIPTVADTQTNKIEDDVSETPKS
jgi:hypothetical protein